jgi:hypothetical protein
MGTDYRTMAVAVAAGLILAGCGKRHSESQFAADEATNLATAGAEFMVSSTEPPVATAANVLPSGGGEFTQKSMASPFAQADRALRENYDSALIAFQIGDYARAGAELRLLAELDLTPEQASVVQDLLAQTLKAAPELASTGRAVAAEGTDGATPSGSRAAGSGTVQEAMAFNTREARPGGAEFTRKSMASPFAQAHPALKESYDSILVAVQIGDYDRAFNEIDELAGTADLTAAEKQALLDLLAQMLKAAPGLASNPPAGPADHAKPPPRP